MFVFGCSGSTVGLNQDSRLLLSHCQLSVNNTNVLVKNQGSYVYVYALSITSSFMKMFNQNFDINIPIVQFNITLGNKIHIMFDMFLHLYILLIFFSSNGDGRPSSLCLSFASRQDTRAKKCLCRQYGPE